MKYRIKIVTSGTGEKTYYPQFKKFLFWRNFKKLVSIGVGCPNNYVDVSFNNTISLGDMSEFRKGMSSEDIAIQRVEKFITEQKSTYEHEKKYNKKEISYKYDV